MFHGAGLGWEVTGLQSSVLRDVGPLPQHCGGRSPSIHKLLPLPPPMALASWTGLRVGGGRGCEDGGKDFLGSGDCGQGQPGGALAKPGRVRQAGTVVSSSYLRPRVADPEAPAASGGARLGPAGPS